MIRVNLFHDHPSRRESRIVEMPAVPRVGDNIVLDISDAALRVTTVIWTPSHKSYDVQVRFR